MIPGLVIISYTSWWLWESLYVSYAPRVVFMKRIPEEVCTWFPLCCVMLLFDTVKFTHKFRITSLALGHSGDCPSDYGATLSDTAKWIGSIQIKTGHIIITTHSTTKSCTFIMGNPARTGRNGNCAPDHIWTWLCVNIHDISLRKFAWRHTNALCQLQL